MRHTETDSVVLTCLESRQFDLAEISVVETLGRHCSQESVQISSLVAKSKLVVELMSRFSSGQLESLEQRRIDIENVSGIP